MLQNLLSGEPLLPSQGTGLSWAKSGQCREIWTKGIWKRILYSPCLNPVWMVPQNFACIAWHLGFARRECRCRSALDDISIFWLNWDAMNKAEPFLYSSRYGLSSFHFLTAFLTAVLCPTLNERHESLNDNLSYRAKLMGNANLDRHCKLHIATAGLPSKSFWWPWCWIL